MKGLVRWRLSLWIATIALLLIPAASLADSATDSAAGSAASGTLPGIVAGAALAILFGYALWTYAEPLIRERDRAFGWMLLGLLVLWGFKTLALGIFSGYALDLGTYEAWARRMASVGPAQMYGRLFSRLSAGLSLRVVVGRMARQSVWRERRYLPHFYRDAGLSG